MNRKAFMRLSRRLALALAASALVASSSLAQTQFLVAMPFEEMLPDGVTVEMWGFALDTGQPCPATPLADWDVGPELVLTAGANLTIKLRNCLTEPISVVIPGQTPFGAMPVQFLDPQGRTRTRSYTDETGVGVIGTYIWTGLDAGTYLYQSGTHPAKQVPMGLYGALIVNDGSYPGVPYDNEVTLLYSEIDPELHAPASGATPLNYKPDYFLVNGAPYSASQVPLPAGNVDQDLLIRFLNAGLKPHTPTIQGGYLEVRAEDGNPYPYPRKQYSVLLPPGKTLDAIWRPTTPGDHAVYDRALYLTSAGAPEGGMLTYLAVAAPAAAAATSGAPLTAPYCGLGFELGLLLPVLMRLRRRGER